MPQKAAYLALESDPEFEFEFFLAEKLHMTVGRLRREMANDELVHWSIYYGRKAQDAELAAKRSGQGR